MAEQPRKRGTIPDKGKSFVFSKDFRVILRPTKSPVQLIMQAPSCGIKW